MSRQEDIAFLNNNADKGFVDGNGNAYGSLNKTIPGLIAGLKFINPKKLTNESDEAFGERKRALVRDNKLFVQKLYKEIKDMGEQYVEDERRKKEQDVKPRKSRTKVTFAITENNINKLKNAVDSVDKSVLELLLEENITVESLSMLGTPGERPPAEAATEEERPPAEAAVGEEEEEEESTPTTQVLVPVGSGPAATVATVPVEGEETALAVTTYLAGETARAAAKALEEQRQVATSAQTGDGNFLNDDVFEINVNGNLITVTPRATYAPYKEEKAQIDLIAMFIQRYAQGQVTDEGIAVGKALENALSYREGLEKLSVEEITARLPQSMSPSADPLNPNLPTPPLVTLPTVPPTTNPFDPSQPSVVPSTNPFDPNPFDGSLNPGTAGSVPIGDTSLNPLADGEDGDEEQPTGPQGAIQAPPTKFKPRYHKESIKIFFGNDENPPWDLQLERSISELTWGKEGFNKAMNGLIEKHSMDFFIWEKKSDGTEEEFNEICQVYFCFLRQLQRGSRAPTANVPLSALLGFGNKLAQAAGGLGDATFSSTEGGMAGGAGGVTTRTRPPPYGPFQGVSPYNLPPGQKGGGPFSGKSPYEVPKGKQSNKSLRSMVKTAAMMEAEKLVRVPQNEAITRVVDAFDKRPMNWANKPLANEYIIEAAARLPRGNLEGGADPKDPTDAFQYGIATPAAKAFNFKIRKPPVVKTVRNF